MSDAAALRPLGLAGLLSAMQPRPPEPPPPPIDIDAIRDGGWHQGFAAGEAHAQAELAPLRLALAEAAAALQAACNIDGDRLRPLLADMIRQIAEAVVMGELRADTAVLARLVDAALALVRPGEAMTLRAHPSTLALLRPQLADIAVVEDPGLAPDAFAVTGTDFVIETGLSARLAEIMGAIA
jgi:flagellar biosynthesis/type III secretory pathway protein FliH